MKADKQKLATIVANGEFVSETTKGLLNTLMGDISGDLKYLLGKLFNESGKSIIRINPIPVLHNEKRIEIVAVMVSPIPGELMLLYKGNKNSDIAYISDVMVLNTFDLSKIYENVVEALKKEI